MKRLLEVLLVGVEDRQIAVQTGDPWLVIEHVGQRQRCLVGVERIFEAPLLCIDNAKQVVRFVLC